MAEHRPLNEKVPDLLNQEYVSKTNEKLLRRFFNHIEADPNISEDNSIL